MKFRWLVTLTRVRNIINIFCTLKKWEFSQLQLYVWMEVATDSPLIYGTALCVKVSFTRQSVSFNDFESRWRLLHSYFYLSKNLQNEQRNFETSCREKDSYHYLQSSKEQSFTNCTTLQAVAIVFDHIKS